MIERNGFKIHVDAPTECTTKSRFSINGWVAADEAVNAIWVLPNRLRPLSFYERPDVMRVFPAHSFVRGFSGEGRRNAMGKDGLRLGLRVGAQDLEIAYALPPGPPPMPFSRLYLARLKLWILGLRASLASTSSSRWKMVLQKHLLLRDLRSNLFRREHADSLLADFARALPGAFFVQIGANDGLTGDPLVGLLAGAGSKWRGVMVEPVTHLFTQLCHRYGTRSGLRLENAAIGETDGTITIYRIHTGKDDPLWLEQLASADRGLLQRNAGSFGEYSDRIIGEEVPCLTVKTLLERDQIQSIDLLLIDTEGWDWCTLRQFNLTRLEPRLILYEHQHLSRQEQEDAHSFLERHGYEWAETPEGDTIAWRWRDR